MTAITRPKPAYACISYAYSWHKYLRPSAAHRLLRCVLARQLGWKINKVQQQENKRKLEENLISYGFTLTGSKDEQPNRLYVKYGTVFGSYGTKNIYGLNVIKKKNKYRAFQNKFNRSLQVWCRAEDAHRGEIILYYETDDVLLSKWLSLWCGPLEAGLAVGTF